MSDVNLLLFPARPASRKSSASLLLRADELEREVEDLRSEAESLDERAHQLRLQAEMTLATEGMALPRLRMLERIIENQDGFVRAVCLCAGQHPFLWPLRAVLADLDTLYEELSDRGAEERVAAVIKPLEVLLHTGEVAAMTGRIAA